MSALLDHFWRQVFGCSTICQAASITVEEVRPTEISKFYRVVGVQQNVLWLYISMNDGRIHGMQVLASRYDLSQVLCSLLLIQTAFLLKYGIELPLRAVLKNQIEVVVIFIVIVELHDILMIQIVHDLDFELDLLHQVMLNNLDLVDNLDGENVF